MINLDIRTNSLSDAEVTHTHAVTIRCGDYGAQREEEMWKDSSGKWYCLACLRVKKNNKESADDAERAISFFKGGCT